MKNFIINNEELIKLVLNKCEFYNISDDFNHGKEYRCAWDIDSNPTAVRVKKDTLLAQSFSHNIKGDLITLVQEKLQLSFTKSIQKIADIVNFKDTEQIEYRLPFGGYYKNIMRLKSDEHLDLKTYSDSILDDYLIMPSERFIKDGIDYKTQQEFSIGYCNRTDRIILPWKNLNGEICGIMGRLNKDEIEPNESKWLPEIPFPKSRTLYGFSDNYKYIQKDNMVILFESEKSVLKCRTNGVNCALALGGSSLSDYQANNINSLFPKNIIIAMDEGLNEDVSMKIASKLKLSTYFHNKVGYIYDSKNEILPKGSKLSPADLPLEEMRKLIVEHVKWI